MIVLTADGGYGTQDVGAARAVIDRHLPAGSRDKVVLLELLYDYERLLSVIRGDGAIYWHADGSETRRLKIYS